MKRQTWNSVLLLPQPDEEADSELPAACCGCCGTLPSAATVPGTISSLSSSSLKGEFRNIIISILKQSYLKEKSKAFNKYAK